MAFVEITQRIVEDRRLLDTLRAGRADFRTLSKLENIMVRDLLILTYTCYQEYVVEAVMAKVKLHSNNHKAIVHFIHRRIEKTNIEVKNLSDLLTSLLPQYGTNFKPEELEEECIRSYTNIVLGRINVAHEQGNNLQIHSISEVEEAHSHAKQVLEAFQSCLW